VFVAGGQRTVAIAGFRDQVQAGLLGEERAEALACHGFVVGDEDFHVIVWPGIAMGRS
jgi:hypothetical protein